MVGQAGGVGGDLIEVEWGAAAGRVAQEGEDGIGRWLGGGPWQEETFLTEVV